MTSLPVIPKPGTAICIADIERMEAHVAREVMSVDDVDQLQEWRAQAAALEAYLRGKELNGPMLGAQRRVEARIGQLLGESRNGGDPRKEHFPRMGSEITATDRQRFRILARGLERGLPDEAWRSAREPLLQLIQERYPMPRHVPTVITKEGAVRKPAEQRAKEIERLAAGGHRAAQIADKLGITEQQVRNLSRDAGIELPDAAMGKRLKLNPLRILTETVNGVDAYVSGLSLLDDLELPQLSPTEADELQQALARSINGLKKLHNRIRKHYAGTNATAA